MQAPTCQCWNASIKAKPKVSSHHHARLLPADDHTSKLPDTTTMLAGRALVPTPKHKQNSSVQPCSIGPVMNPALSKLQTRASHAPHRARYDCTSSWEQSHTPDKQALQCLECLQGLNQYICRHSSLQLLQQQLPGNSKLPPPEALLQATQLQAGTAALQLPDYALLRAAASRGCAAAT